MRKSFFANRALAFSLILSISIATTEVPTWISAFSFTLILWRFLYEKLNIYKLSPKITPLFGVLIFVIVYMQYRTILGQEESTTVLLGLVSLSILNYSSDRDNLFLVLLGFLMVVIKSVFSLDFIWTIPALISFFGLWLSLLTTQGLNKYKFLFVMAFKSLPIFVMLFFLFPRFVIFQSKQTQKILIQSGFNEDLNPGKFGEVSLQSQIVFRADFKMSLMNSEELYWRGAVLNISKGLSWQKGVVDRLGIASTSDQPEEGVIYRIILEPSNLKTVFVLDSPISVSSTTSQINELQYHSFALSELPTQQVQYEAQASLSANRPELDDPTEMRKYLTTIELPPKTKAFVDEIKSKRLSPRDRVDVLRKFFRERGFIYTLKPGKYEGNLDEFLFDRKKGFCEHFAAALGTLARALDVPSRVVLGYQGGIYNSIGNFWKISQKDAHAWVEVGLDNKWVRLDPTGWVSPLRLTLGGENYFSLSEEEQILYSKNVNWKKPENFRNLLMDLTFALENLNYYWTVLLLNYDLQAQLEYLKHLRANGMVGGLILLSLIALFIYNRNTFLPPRQHKHALFDLFNRIELWGIKQGLQFAKNQTPLQVLGMIIEKYPSLREVIANIASDYVRSAYENKDTINSVESLQKFWKEASRQVLK